MNPEEQVNAQFQVAFSLYRQGKHREAEQQYAGITQLIPDWYEPYYHQAVCFQSCRDYEQALPHYLAALGLHSKDPMLIYHAAKCLKDAGHLSAALPLYLQSLKLQPDLYDAQYSLGLLHLLKGNWLEGWKGYALRGLGSDRAKIEKLTDTGSLIPWKGGDVPIGAKLLVTCEQGMGDALMAFRFVYLLRKKFDYISFTVHAPLVALFQSNAPSGVQVLPWNSAPIAYTQYTHAIAMMDLPSAFATTPENVPNQPYLTAPPTANTTLLSMLTTLSKHEKFKVGIVWQGGKISVANGRDVPFETLKPLFQDAQLNTRVQWVSLQKDIKVEGLPNLINAMLAIDNFAETAALVDKLDLVIGVDTAVVHLVGAMGKPVWLLNRYESEWRWMKNKTNTPWYPSMRIFNESRPGQWGSVINEIHQEVSRLVL